MTETPPPKYDSHDQKPDKIPKITLKVQFVDKDADPLTLKVKATTTFQKIYGAVARHKGVEHTSFKLLLNGQRLAPNDVTPADLQLEDEETLDYVVEQVGGQPWPIRNPDAPSNRQSQ